MAVNVHAIGYWLAAGAFLVFSVLLATGRRRRTFGAMLLVATSVSVVWALGLIHIAEQPTRHPFELFVLEIAQDGAWLLFLATMMKGATGGERVWLFRYGGVILAATILLLGVGREVADRFYGMQTGGAGGLLVVGSLLTALFGLVAIEQLYRNARSSQRYALKYLCLGLGFLFAYDLFLYSNAIVIGQLSPVFWEVRGYVVAMVVPLIAVSARRASSWSVGIFVSRQIVFYGSTVLGAGIYLTLVGFLGYYLRVVGGAWGSAAQMVLFFAGLLVLGVFLFSDRIRARARVFIVKHFYENKFDYREEWLRLIETLTSSEDGLPLKKRALKAIAQILGSPVGLLWLRSGDDGNYRCVANWNTSLVDTGFAADHPVVRFMQQTGWVIERKGLEARPAEYEGLALADLELPPSTGEFVIPIRHEDQLLGFVSLGPSPTTSMLNFEDRDLLKTAGQQIASYLAQEKATEQLAENRQFEAFNRLTAYLMHDLKNVIAQQSLIVENAPRHRDNPEFVDDAFETIKGSVVRMKRVIEQLQQSPSDRRHERVEVGKIIMQAVSNCADRQPQPRALIGERQVWVSAEPERLLMALYHAIRNAQDATPSDGEVSVELDDTGDDCTVTIIDTGSGMSETFIRERLFRPFDSTKGTQGMGIGAYQVRATIRAMGGDVAVESAPGEGTRLVLKLPRAG